MDDSLVRELSLFESLSKLFAIALGFLYFLGFLVVAFHLSRYGVSSFALLQVQYLIAGIWALGPPVSIASLHAVERRFSERAAPEIAGRFNWRRFAVSNVLSAIPASAFFVLIAATPNVYDQLTWGTAIRFFLFFFGMWSLAQLFWVSYRAPKIKETWVINRSHAAPFYLSSLMVIVFSYSLWFSMHIYPLIPFSMGGGKPLTVIFFEGEKKMPDEIRKADQTAKRSVPYQLILSTDKVFVVVSPSNNERSVEISRESVAGLVVLTAN